MVGSKLAPGPTPEDIKRGATTAQAGVGSQSQPQRQSKLLPLPAKLPAAAPTPSPRPRSDSASSGSSSSTDTTEAEERDRLAALGPPPRPIHRPVFSLLSILAFLLVAHLTGFYLFSSGFLLTRRELTGIATCSSEPVQDWTPPLPPSSEKKDEIWYKEWNQVLEDGKECTLPKKYNKTIFFLIDALRWDMISPIPSNTSSWTPDSNLHGHLTIPSELDSSGPGSSFLSHFLADAPTTTLQRLKGLTTGTLPTFIDAGANFGAGTIAEDNWLGQLRSREMRNRESEKSGLALMGDDTWEAVFPSMFDSHMSWPFSSFNVEDLDTVDNGVREKLFSILDPSSPNFNLELSQDWSLLVAHTLGVDHVGHRFGASHPKMATKLQEMNELIKTVVELMDEETLFILIGDHGMDATGDHGGEGELEVGAGLWIYSKREGEFSSATTQSAEDQAPLRSILQDLPSSDMIPNYLPFSPLPSPPFSLHRSVPQIDLVPTLSLLLGLPVPFNSLGAVIPELFTSEPAHADRLLRSLRINAQQLHTYLVDYQSKSSDLSPVSSEIEDAWKAALLSDSEYSEALHSGNQDLVIQARQRSTKLYYYFLRVSLFRAREVWAQFDEVKMLLGIASLVVAMLTTGLIWLASEKGLQKTYLATPKETEAASKPIKKTGKNGKKLLAKSKNVGKKDVRTEGTEQLATQFFQDLRSGGLVGVVLAISLSLVKVVGAGGLIIGISSLDLGIFFPILSSQLLLLWRQRALFSSSTTSMDSEAADQDEEDEPSNPLSFTNFSHSLSILRCASSSKVLSSLGLLLPVIHSALFGSNSFTVWEDKAVLLLFSTAVGIRMFKSLGSQTSRLRNRLPLFGLLILVCGRIMAHHTVCREEQAPWCKVTFYSNPNLDVTSSGSSNSSDTGGLTGPKLNSPFKIAVSYATAYALPYVVAKFLNISKSNSGPAPFFLNWLVRPTLLAAAGYWAADWVGNSPSMEGYLGTENGDEGVRAWLDWAKLTVARADLTLLCVGGSIYWLLAPLCLNLREEPIDQPSASASASSIPGSRSRVIVHGFSNSLGASHLLFGTLVFSLLYLVSQPSGQISLALGFICLVSLFELGDGERDDRLMREATLIREKLDSRMIPGLDRNTTTLPSTTKTISENLIHQLNLSPPLPTLLETTTIGLLSHLLFFTSGHQATLSSIQWRSAFIGVSSVSYPISPILVVLNSFGPYLILPGILLPLLAVWNLPPVPRGPPGTQAPQRMKSLLSILRAAMGLILYFGLISLSATIFAAKFKRHLMLFKVWTPRFILAAVGLVGIQVSILIGVVVAGIVAGKVTTTFGSEFA